MKTIGDRLALVVFTGGPLTPVNRVFFERLSRDPRLRLLAIVVDDFAPARASWPLRTIRAWRREGWPWLWFKVCSKLSALGQRLALAAYELTHPPVVTDDSYEALERRIGVPIHRVSDIHSEASLALVRSLDPELGIIVGGRILRDALITIPSRGTLNIHKRKVPEYRGGGPVGYWEVLAGESSIGITIHYAVTQVDAGSVLAETTVPIEACDTLESLRIKADLRGAQLYHETIGRFAEGACEATPQDAAGGATYRAPSESSVWRLERRLRRKARQTMPALATRPSAASRLRVLAQYLVLLPVLLGIRARLVASRRAPIAILFYHVVANRPVNHMCLPLEEFVRQVEFLRRYYGVSSLDQATDRARSGVNHAVGAAITFDDGYQANRWAIEYLKYFGIPATFFVSIGHVRDGSHFLHDARRGFDDAAPMSEADVARLAADGFTVGSHAIHHEDFGTLEPERAAQVLDESRRLLGAATGREPEHFAFPRGQRANMTSETLTLAQQHYRCVYSAHGGYNLPAINRRHFARIANPASVIELAMTMDGYTGLRQCLSGNAWGRRGDARRSLDAPDEGGVERMRRTLSAGWQRWKRIAHAIGTFQARLILAVLYVVLLPPFALIARLSGDPLQRRAPGPPRWLTRTATPSTLQQGRRQFS